MRRQYIIYRPGGPYSGQTVPKVLRTRDRGYSVYEYGPILVGKRVFSFRRPFKRMEQKPIVTIKVSLQTQCIHKCVNIHHESLIIKNQA